MPFSTENPLATEPPAEGWRSLLAVFGGYMALALLFTWPLALHLGGGAIQRGTLPVDAGQGIWNLWWARTALLSGASPYQTTYLFYPLSVDLFYQTLSLPNALLAWPALLLSPVLAFNMLALLSFGLGGLFAYRLARAIVPGRAAALLAGFVYAFTPYHTQRLWGGSLELICVQWLPLYVLLLMRALHRRTPASALAAGLALLLVTLASQYYGLYAVIYTLGHVLLALIFMSSWRIRLAGLATAAGVGGVWLLGLLPFIWPLSTLGGAAIEDWYERQLYHSAALVDFVLPSALHPLWGGPAASLQNSLHPFGLETGAALGLGIYLLCGVALARRWRQSWPWLALALLMALLALGPELKLAEASTGLPLPFQLLDLIGPFRNSSRPSVFIGLMMIPVALLAGMGLAALHTTKSAKGTKSKQYSPHLRALRALRGRYGLPSIALIALVLLEALVAPWQILPMQAGPGYAALAADPTEGAVLELPPRNNDSQHLLNQICHGRPLVGGYLARLPYYPLLSGESALNRLWEARAATPDLLPLDPAAELASLGVRYVVLDLTQLTRGQIARLSGLLATPGISHVDSPEGQARYTIDPAAGGLAAALGPGWLALEQAEGRRWRWLGDEAIIELIAARSGPATLSLSATAYAADRPLTIWQGDQLIYSALMPAAPAERRLMISLLLPAGSTQLRLAAPAERAADGREISLSVRDLRAAALPVAPGYRPAERPIPPRLAEALSLCGEAGR
jgi:hypothetical protein